MQSNYSPKTHPYMETPFSPTKEGQLKSLPRSAAHSEVQEGEQRPYLTTLRQKVRLRSGRMFENLFSYNSLCRFANETSLRSNQ